MKTRLVHIIGGGFSGLMAAYFFRRQGFQVRVSEAKRWGGLIRTEASEWGPVESAANGFLLTDSLAEVARDLGVTLLTPKRESRKRWIANEKPQRLPVSPFTLASAGLHWVSHKVRHDHQPRAREVLSDWGKRVLNERLQDRVLLPAVQGIYGVDSRRLSASLVLRPFFDKDRARRRGLVSPAGGMGEWIDRLVQKLRLMGVDLREEELSAIPDADLRVLACGSDTKARLLRSTSPVAANALAGVQRLPVLSVTAFFRPGPDDMKGFGILFHPDHQWKASGVLFNSEIFENRGPHRSETWIFPKPEVMDASEEKFATWLREERLRLGMANELLGLKISRWPRALPLYSTALEDFLERDLDLPKGVHLLGHEMGEIGLTGLAERASLLAHDAGLGA